MRRTYYDKRQIIDVVDFETIDFNEKILICVPKFAWVVARSYLSLQAQWASSYGVEYFSNGYETPSEAQIDIIKANLAEFLAEVDMSCDLEAVLQEIADYLQVMAEKDCSVELSCTVGSAGAGGSEATPESFEDDGVDPPSGFDTYAEYKEFKCGVATLIVESLIKDLEYVQDTPFTEYIAVALAATLISPIPGDEVVVLVGALLALVAEGVLDSILSGIITTVETHKDDLICDLYEALDVDAAKAVFTSFAIAYLSGPAGYVFSFWKANDNFNLLFKIGNFFLPTSDCSGCTPPSSEVQDSFTDIDGTSLLVHTPEVGGPWLGQVGTWTIQGNQADTTSVSGARVNIEGGLSESLASFTLYPTSTTNKSARQGITVRGNGLGNYFLAGWVGGGTSGYFIGKRVSGTWSQLAFVSAPEVYDPKEIAVKCEGDFIDLYIGGAPVLQVEDTFNVTATEYGLEFGNAGQAKGDNFLVTAIP